MVVKGEGARHLHGKRMALLSSWAVGDSVEEVEEPVYVLVEVVPEVDQKVQGVPNMMGE